MNDNLSLILAYIFIKLGITSISLETFLSIVDSLNIDYAIDMISLKRLRFNSAIFTIYNDGKNYKIALRNGITIEDLSDNFMNIDIKNRTK